MYEHRPVVWILVDIKSYVSSIQTVCTFDCLKMSSASENCVCFSKNGSNKSRGGGGGGGGSKVSQFEKKNNTIWKIEGSAHVENNLQQLLKENKQILINIIIVFSSVASKATSLLHIITVSFQI